jgi:heat shock protein HtpX
MQLFNTLKTTLLLGLMMGLCIAVGAVWGRDGMIYGFAIGGGMSLFSYFFSDKLALAGAGAKPVSKEEAPELYAMTERLAQRAGIPMPRLYYSEQQAPNAFATGRNPSHAAVCVTTGIMQMLTADELEGVIGHELSHVKHRDILISTIAAVMAGAISVIARMMFWFGGDRRNNRNGGGGIEMVAMLLTIILAPIAAMLIQMAISRSREFAADASGAQLAGGPMGLISALKKLEVGNLRYAMNINPSERHMFIVMPRVNLGGAMADMFRTHPSTESRIAALLKLADKPNPYAGT